MNEEKTGGNIPDGTHISYREKRLEETQEKKGNDEVKKAIQEVVEKSGFGEVLIKIQDSAIVLVEYTIKKRI